MKCKKCGNETDFRLMREMAEWVSEKELWIEDFLDDEIMCGECGSFDIEDEEWDFETN